MFLKDGMSILKRHVYSCQGIPVVVTFTQTQADPSEDLVENCRKIEEGGADVVGLNCGGGPVTTLPIIKKIRQVCKVSQCLFALR